MRLSVNKMTGLRLLRAARQAGMSLSARRCDLAAPDASPRRRWSASIVPLRQLALTEPPTAERRLDVAVPKASQRLRASFASCTVYGSRLPAGAFVDLGEGIQVAGPELLFLEMADVLPVPVHVLLGFELCGTFGRDPWRPRTGDVAFDLAPATSVERIRGFILSCRYFGDVADRALERLEYVADNAWSPMEAVLASMVALPVTECGYGLGRVALNRRRENPAFLVERGCPGSRVPDVEVLGTALGFNYDGRGHFDLESVAAAASDDARRAAMRAVREKYLDDLRRNRELMARGLVVLPVTSEDLFHEGGCDALVYEALSLLDELGRPTPSEAWGALESATLSRVRQEVLWSILPWAEAPRYARGLWEREERAWSRACVEETTIAL